MPDAIDCRILDLLQEDALMSSATVAEQVGLSPTPCWRRIKKLEDELGVKLFERRQHDVSVTPIGERVVNQARIVLEEAETVRHIAQEGLDDFVGCYHTHIGLEQEGFNLINGICTQGAPTHHRFELIYQAPARFS